MSARAHAQPGTRRHGLSAVCYVAAPDRPHMLNGLSAAHPLELGDGDPFDGRRRPVRVVHLVRGRARARARVRARVRVRVRVVHRPRRHGRDRSSVGPVRTTGYCAAQAPLSMLQRCVRVRVQMRLHAVGLRARASRTDVLAHVPADGTLDALHVAVATHVTDRVAFPLRSTHGLRWRPRLRE